MPPFPPGGPIVRADRSVQFRFHAPNAQGVRLAASFTHWSLRPLAFQHAEASGWWEVTTPPLHEGVHFYKFIVDGTWLHDPAHPLVTSDGCGGFNSLLGVGGPTIPADHTVRIASLNLHTYQEADPLRKLDQIAHVVAALDVDALALQEVAEHMHDPGQPNAGEFLRQRLEHYTGQTWHHEWRMAHIGFHVYREGVSLLARVPLEQVVEYRLSTGQFPRSALFATLELKQLRLRLGSLHLSWPGDGGAAEVNTLLTHLDTGDVAATLIAGDMNAHTDDEQIQRFLTAEFVDVACRQGSQGFATAGPQYWQDITPAGTGSRAEAGWATRIDYHFLRSSQIEIAGCWPIFNGRVTHNVYQPVVSDHLGLLTAIRTVS